MHVTTSLNSVDVTIVAAMVGSMISELRFVFATMVAGRPGVSPMDAMVLMNAVEEFASATVDRLAGA